MDRHSATPNSDPIPAAQGIDHLPEVTRTPIVRLGDGDVFDLRAFPVRRQLGDRVMRMLAYNGAIPGPTLMVPQHAEVTIHFTNEIELDTTVHWHGVRLDNRFDGVAYGAHHHGMQPPIPPGGHFTYRVTFPDPGVYWYHPHIREDYTQDLGLYGNIVVQPSEPSYWPPVNRELALVLDDILGDVMLVNGETDYTLTAHRGEVVRLYLTNTANGRNFAVRIPGVSLKLVGGDIGRAEREMLVDEIVLSPSERAIVDVLFERPGRFSLASVAPDLARDLATILVDELSAEPAYVETYFTLRENPEMRGERLVLPREIARPPDKTLDLKGHELIDRETGATNHEIYWSFRTGDRVKIRIVNQSRAEHGTPHPIHFHGQCFLVLSRDGVPNENLIWKDTVLVRTGETVDLLMNASNPGVWMVHCHIAEHLEAGMMFSFDVR